MKLKRIVALLLVAVLATFAIASCGADKYTVTFNSNGGSSVASAEVAKDATVTAPAAPTKAGCIFDGWYADSALTDAWDFAADKVTKDVTLYAKWISAASVEASADSALAAAPAEITVSASMSNNGGTPNENEMTFTADGNNYSRNDIVYVDGVLYSGNTRKPMSITGAKSRVLSQAAYVLDMCVDFFETVSLTEANGKYTVTCSGVKESAEDELFEIFGFTNMPEGYNVSIDELSYSFVVSAGKYESMTFSVVASQSYGENTMSASINMSASFDYDAEAVVAPADADSYTWQAMSYGDYVDVPVDSFVVVEAYIQDKQSWWFDSKAGYGKGTFYLQDSSGGAYFLYELKCTEEEYNALAIGTRVQLQGYKAEWNGEVEIIDATYTIIPYATYIAQAFDITDKLDDESLIDYQNRKVAFKGMTVSGEFMYGWNGAGSEGGDLYFKADVDGKTYTFVVESYLRGADTDVYKAVKALKVGDVIDMEGFLYWYEGAQPHITSVTVK